MKIILCLLIIIIILLILIKQNKKETFEYPSKTIDAAIIFTGYKIDEWDYNFINKWYKDIKFYFVFNYDETNVNNKWVKKIESLKKVTTLKRPNLGWDATAWKDCIIKYYNELKKYDEVFLINNSMNYEKLNMKEIVEMAPQYDIYGLYYTQLTKHIDSYFTGFNKKIFNSKAFKHFFFDNFPIIETHGEAVLKYEMVISKYFNDLGCRFGAYISNKRPHTSTYAKFPDYVNLNDVKWVTKKTHLKGDNYKKWKKISCN